MLGLSLALTSCGYAPVRSAEATKLSVQAGPHALPQLQAVQAALAGARSELGHLGKLADSNAYPTLVVEVFHVEEQSSGVRAPTTTEQPLARGSGITLSGRAWILDSASAPARADTGPVRVATAFSSGPSETADAERNDAALALAGRKLGRLLARKALGLPAAGVGK